jgi:hypothetical protein
MILYNISLHFFYIFYIFLYLDFPIVNETKKSVLEVFYIKHYYGGVFSLKNCRFKDVKETI